MLPGLRKMKLRPKLDRSPPMSGICNVLHQTSTPLLSYFVPGQLHVPSIVPCSYQIILFELYVFHTLLLSWLCFLGADNLLMGSVKRSFQLVCHLSSCMCASRFLTCHSLWIICRVTYVESRFVYWRS